jgi:PLP dependent protein
LDTNFCTQRIAQNYKIVRAKIAEACRRSGRDPSSVNLMLVTKTIESDRLKEVLGFGHKLFGENKVQELKKKAEQLPDQKIDWHFIGHLQQNKLKDCLKYASTIQSIDSLSHVYAIDRQLQKIGKSIEVLVQINTSYETSKFGLDPKDAIRFLNEIRKFDTLKVKGLMTLALFSSEEKLVRPCFKKLKNLFDEVNAEAINGIEMTELSMGMSSDYEYAIEEGATMVRIGQGVFGHRRLPDSYYWSEEMV